MDKNLQGQLMGVESLLEQEKAKGPQKDADVIARLETQQADILLKMDDEKAKAEQTAAQQVVIQEATVKAEYFLDNLEVEGLSMSQLSASEDAYKLLRMAVQNKFVELEGQAANKLNLQEIAQKEEIRAIQTELTNATAERNDFISKLKNAADEIGRLNSHIDDLRNEIAVGAQQAYKVVDLDAQAQQMKELADKIKASRIHVYDVVPDNDINPKNFTAKRVDNGESITYNWTQENNYIVLKDEAEVSRFRDQHAAPTATEPVAEAAVQDTPLVTIPEALHVSEGNIPSQSEVPTPNTVASGVSSTDGKSGETVTAEQLETRLAQFAVEHGLVQQQAVA